MGACGSGVGAVGRVIDGSTIGASDLQRLCSAIGAAYQRELRSSSHRTLGEDIFTGCGGNTLVVTVGNSYRQVNGASLLGSDGNAVLIELLFAVTNLVGNHGIANGVLGSNGNGNLFIQEVVATGGSQGYLDSGSRIEVVGCGSAACALMVETVGHVDRQGHVASLVVRNVDALLRIIGLHSAVDRIGDGTVGDVVLNTHLYIHLVTNGVILTAVRSQRDSECLSGIEVVGSGSGSLVVTVQRINRYDYVASSSVGQNDTSLGIVLLLSIVDLVGHHGALTAVLNGSVNRNIVTHGITLSLGSSQCNRQLRLNNRLIALLNINPSPYGLIIVCIVSEAGRASTLADISFGTTTIGEISSIAV